MATVVYLAYPIDQAGDAPGLWDDYQIVKNHMIREPGLAFYDPGRAWNAHDTQPDPRIQAVNTAALLRADAVVAILPPDVSSVGVPMEVAWAVSAGIPVLVLRNAFSWALQLEGVQQFDHLGEFLGEISHLMPLDRKTVGRPQLRWVDESADDEPSGEPKLGYPDDAGFDLTYVGSAGVIIHPDGESINVPCGMRFEFPPHTWGLIIGRSSTFHRRGLLVNTAVIDPGYRGPMFVSVRSLIGHPVTIQPGERIAQLIPLPALAPKMDVVRVDELSATDRGENGFGSSGT